MVTLESRVRPVGFGIRAFLWVAAPLAFLGGAQVTLLSEHTETYWAWTIALPISAIFIGASFLATSVLFAWGLGQREWIRVRAVVSGGPFVTLGLLIATVRHVSEFHGAVGVIWVEAYVFAVPAFFAAACHQRLVLGRDRPVEARLPPWLRGALGLQALVMLVWGVLLFARPHHASAVWAWPLAPLAAEAIAAWLLGIGGSAAYIALRGDRADMPGAALSYIVLGAIWIGGAIFAGGAFHNGRDAVLYIAFAASVIAVGAAGAFLSYREGRYQSQSGGLELADR
ncbi:MAG TPA: hypothetical protein VKB54_04560 [Solirubrobacteraceae bacterium]|nr:hypothetical protein [Solirubrobacteraceae bacterium]